MSSEDAAAFHLRDYRPADAPALAAIYRDAVLQIGATAYDAAQVASWASFAADADAFASTLAEGWLRVAEDEQGPCGFAQVNLPGHLHLLYVSPRRARQGVASALLADCEVLGAAMGARVLSVNASRIARPLLLKHGFVELAVEQAERDGIVFERFQMEKRLAPLR